MTWRRRDSCATATNTKVYETIGCLCTGKQNCRWYAPTKISVEMTQPGGKPLTRTNQEKLPMTKKKSSAQWPTRVTWWVDKKRNAYIKRLLHYLCRTMRFISRERSLRRQDRGGGGSRANGYLALPVRLRAGWKQRCNTPALRGVARDHDITSRPTQTYVWSIRQNISNCSHNLRRNAEIHFLKTKRVC